MKTFIINEPVFKVEPLFVGNCTYNELGEYIEKRFKVTIESKPLTVDGTVLTFQKAPWRVVWMRDFCKSPRKLGTSMHEIFHLVTRICQDKGIPIMAHIETGECGDETAAYLFDYFSREFLKRAFNQKRN